MDHEWIFFLKLNRTMCLGRQVTDGMETLRTMEGLETKKEGIFVMPVKRATIFSTFMIYVADPKETVATAWSFLECGAFSFGLLLAIHLVE
jgi:hypothetical protein